MPDQEEALNSLMAIKKGGNKVKIPDGRISGVGKIARGYIEQIEKGTLTFTEVFNTATGQFEIAR